MSFIILEDGMDSTSTVVGIDQVVRNPSRGIAYRPQYRVQEPRSQGHYVLRLYRDATQQNFHTDLIAS